MKIGWEAVVLTPAMTEYSVTLFADDHQVYLRDSASTGMDDANWNDAALKARVVVMEDAFAVSTARSMDVTVTVVVAPDAPDLDLSCWDHVVAFSIKAPSGQLAILGCTDCLPDAARLDVPAGVLCVRVLFAGLNTLSEDGLEGDDHYQIGLWPGAPMGREVIK